MRAPVVTQAPDAILVAVEDADLAVDGAGRAAVAVRVECDGLHNVMVAVGDEVEGGALGRRRRRVVRGGRHGNRSLPWANGRREGEVGIGVLIPRWRGRERAMATRTGPPGLPIAGQFLPSPQPREALAGSRPGIPRPMHPCIPRYRVVPTSTPSTHEALSLQAGGTADKRSLWPLQGGNLRAKQAHTSAHPRRRSSCLGRAHQPRHSHRGSPAGASGGGPAFVRMSSMGPRLARCWVRVVSPSCRRPIAPMKPLG